MWSQLPDDVREPSQHLRLRRRTPPRRRRVGPDEHPHLGDAVAGEPVNERVVGLQRLCRCGRAPACSHSAAQPSMPMQNCCSSFTSPLVASKTARSHRAVRLLRCGRPLWRTASRTWKTNPLVNNELSALLVLTMIAWVILLHCRDVCMLAHVSGRYEAKARSHIGETVELCAVPNR